MRCASAPKPVAESSHSGWPHAPMMAYLCGTAPPRSERLNDEMIAHFAPRQVADRLADLMPFGEFVGIERKHMLVGLKRRPKRVNFSGISLHLNMISEHERDRVRHRKGGKPRGAAPVGGPIGDCQKAGIERVPG